MCVCVCVCVCVYIFIGNNVTTVELSGTCPPCCVDNWGLVYAQSLALARNAALRVCFCLVPSFLDATIRHYMFMIGGLQEVEKVSCYGVFV